MISKLGIIVGEMVSTKVMRRLSILAFNPMKLAAREDEKLYLDRAGKILHSAI